MRRHLRTTESEGPRKTRYFRVSGQVQRVGFRYATRQEAQRLGLNGWVRNCPDGTVEARATGIADSLDQFSRWLHHGPPGARVKQVESDVVDDEDARASEENPTGFEILR